MSIKVLKKILMYGHYRKHYSFEEQCIIEEGLRQELHEAQDEHLEFMESLFNEVKKNDKP